MTEAASEKVTIIATHGPEDPQRATFPFMMANAALVMECEAVVVLPGTSVLLARRKPILGRKGSTLCLRPRNQPQAPGLHDYYGVSSRNSSTASRRWTTWSRR